MRKGVSKTATAHVKPSDVELRPGAAKKGSKDSERFYWHIYHQDSRAGRVFIIVENPGSDRPAPSITVELNERSRGRGIGTIAFERACELSGLPEVFASIRKSNIASKIAAERAGFRPVVDDTSRELEMMWRRETK